MATWPPPEAAPSLDRGGTRCQALQLTGCGAVWQKGGLASEVNDIHTDASQPRND